MKAAKAEANVLVVVVVVIVVHFERVEDGEEVEREICILTTRGPARQWERKKRLIMGPTQEDASFSRMTWRKYCSPFHDKGPISRQKIGLIDTTRSWRSACSSSGDAEAMEAAFGGGIIPANSRCLNHETFYPAIMHDGTPVTNRRTTDRDRGRPTTGGIIIAEGLCGGGEW